MNIKVSDAMKRFTEVVSLMKDMDCTGFEINHAPDDEHGPFTVMFVMEINGGHESLLINSFDEFDDVRTAKL